MKVCSALHSIVCLLEPGAAQIPFIYCVCTVAD